MLGGAETGVRLDGQPALTQAARYLQHPMTFSDQLSAAYERKMPIIAPDDHADHGLACDGCGRTPAFTTDDAIVQLSPSVEITTSPWFPRSAT